MSTSTTSVNFYQTIQRHIAEDSTLDGQPVNNLCNPAIQVETLKEIDHLSSSCNVLFSVDLIPCTELYSCKVCACLLMILQSPDLCQCIRMCQRLEFFYFNGRKNIES
jgi:hypothetical protein